MNQPNPDEPAAPPGTVSTPPQPFGAGDVADSGPRKRMTGSIKRRPTQAVAAPGSVIASQHAGRAPLRRQGLPLAVKFSVVISGLVILTTSLFAFFSITELEKRLMEEVKRAGHDQVLALHGFAQHVVAKFRGVRDPAQFNTVMQQYREKGDLADIDYVRRIKKFDSRVYDIAIFAAAAADANPNVPVLRARTDAQSFTAPNPPFETVPGGDPDVLIYHGDYFVSDNNSKDTHPERCMYFRMPLEKSSNPEKIFSSVNLILSESHIQNEVKSFKTKLIGIGVVFVLAGVGLSLWLASRVSHPISVLVQDMNQVAGGNLDHTSHVAQLTRDEIGLLALAFNQMTQTLRDARGLERESERIAGELNTAKAIHVKLMPEKLPQLPGMDIFTAYHCAKEVGGDYYDFIPVGDTEHLAVCVADVSGKGIPGSMVMGTTRTILRMMAVGNLSAADVLSKTNFHVARDIKRGMFVTCVYAILNVRTREMNVASAGHNPMLVWRAATGTIEKIRPAGIALGFDRGAVFDKTIREQKVRLLNGDRVVLYTDGVVEAMSPRGEEFGEDALDAFVRENATLPSKDFVRGLIKKLDDFKGSGEQHDDITVTTIRIV